MFSCQELSFVQIGSQSVMIPMPKSSNFKICRLVSIFGWNMVMLIFFKLKHSMVGFRVWIFRKVRRFPHSSHLGLGRGLSPCWRVQAPRRAPSYSARTLKKREKIPFLKICNSLTDSGLSLILFLLIYYNYFYGCKKMRAVRAARFCENATKLLILESIFLMDGIIIFLSDRNQKKEKKFLFLSLFLYFLNLKMNGWNMK